MMTSVEYLRELADRIERGAACRDDVDRLRDMADGFDQAMEEIQEYLRQRGGDGDIRRAPRAH